jgi:hypothetical protein
MGAPSASASARRSISAIAVARVATMRGSLKIGGSPHGLALPQKLHAPFAIWQGAVRRLGEMPMKPTILAALAAIALAASPGPAAADPIELQWWHAMTAD